MKPINILLILSLLLLGSCVDKDLNNDPTKSANLNPNFQLTGIELRQWGSMDIVSMGNRYRGPLTQSDQESVELHVPEPDQEHRRSGEPDGR